MSLEADSKRWDSIWTGGGKEGAGEWDYLSEVVFHVLERESGGFELKRVLEAGSGSGRISLRIARRGAVVTLLDYSQAALNISRGLFNREGLSASYIRADIINMAGESDIYDIVWNAGVLEHHEYDLQSRILDKMIGICAPEGIVITLNPYSRSLLYRFGKGFLTILNRWPFGKEHPISSIYDIYKNKENARHHIIEYPIGFIVFFVDAYKFLPKNIRDSKIVKRISDFFIHNAKRLFAADKILSAILGGYLMVSVIKKEKLCEKT